MSTLSEMQVIHVINRALQLNGNGVTSQTSARDVEAWDSMGHLSILAALDQELNGRLAPITEMANATSVPAILQLLRANALCA